MERRDRSTRENFTYVALVQLLLRALPWKERFAGTLIVAAVLVTAPLRAQEVDSVTPDRPHASPSSKTDPSRLWLLGNVSLGGGTGVFDGFYAVASATVHIWPLASFGVNATAATVAAGAPEGPSAQGNCRKLSGGNRRNMR